MKIKNWLFSLIFISNGIFAIDASTSYNATCNDPQKTIYLCCKGLGWTTSQHIFNCQTPENTCKKDTGLVYDTTVTILEDCKQRRGTELVYAPPS